MAAGAITQTFKAGITGLSKLWKPTETALVNSFKLLRGGEFGPAYTALRTGGSDAAKVFSKLTKAQKKGLLAHAATGVGVDQYVAHR